MSKLLLLVALGVIVYVVITGATRKRAARADSAPPAETMVPCAHCGVNLPRSEALETAGRFYCGDEHRRLGPR